VGLWSLRIKSNRLKMPRPCAVEFHVGGYNSNGSLEDATGLSHWYLHKFSGKFSDMNRGCINMNTSHQKLKFV
jgi:hypothetical protein